MEWGQFPMPCDNCQHVDNNKVSWNNSSEVNDSCPDFDLNSNASCDLSWNGSQRKLPRLKPKRTEQPSYQFADHPFVSKRDAKLKRNKALNSKREGTASALERTLKDEEQKVQNFLRANPAFLTTYVTKFVDAQTLNEWSKPTQVSADDTEEVEKNLEHEAKGLENGHGENSTEVGKVDDGHDEEETVLDDKNAEEEGDVNESLEAAENVVVEEEMEEQIELQEIPEIVEFDEGEELSEHMTFEEHEETELTEPTFPENMVTTSTSTEDATVFAADVCLSPPLVSASTSTTDGLILTKPIGLQLPNPKVLANLPKLTKMREARAKQKECEAEKTRRAEQELAHQRQAKAKEERERLLSAQNKSKWRPGQDQKWNKKTKNFKENANRKAGDELDTESCVDGPHSTATGSASRFVDDAFVSLIVKFHNTPPKYCLTNEESTFTYVEEPAFTVDQFTDPIDDSDDTFEAFLVNGGE